MEGVLVVISPLLALMQDQILGLENKGVKAAMLSSMQTMEDCSCNGRKESKPKTSCNVCCLFAIAIFYQSVTSHLPSAQQPFVL
jgi:hypothetical protein